MKHSTKNWKEIRPSIWVFFICATIIGSLALGYSVAMRGGSFDLGRGIQGFLIGVSVFFFQIGLLVKIYFRGKTKAQIEERNFPEP